MNNVAIYREASLYAAVETDEKTNILKHLEKNVDAILRRIHNLLEERSECFKVLSLNQRKWKDIKLQDLIRNQMSQYEEKLSNAIEISRENRMTLVNKLTEQERETTEVQEKLHLEISRLRSILLELRDGNVTEQSLDVMQKSDFLKDIGYSRDCCIQVDLNREKRSKEKCLRIEPVCAMDVCHNSLDVNSDNRNIQTNYHLYGTNDIPSVTLPRLTEGSKESDEEDRLSADFTTGLKCQPFSLHSRNIYFNPKDTGTKDVSSLKHHVSDLALQLRKTKHELDAYEMQLSAMKMGQTNKKTLRSLKSPVTTKSLDSSGTIIDDSNEINGYLSGIQQEIIFPKESKLKTSESLYLHNHFRKSKGTKRVEREKGGFVTSSVTTKCLRCHKVYTVRDNHKMACRYHPKSKKKIEKYDDKGKLVMVNFIWECCLQKPESLGCSSGEHI